MSNGWKHKCVLNGLYFLKCTGRNVEGQTYPNIRFESGIESVSAGSRFTCVLNVILVKNNPLKQSRNVLRCFGSNKDSITDVDAYAWVDVKMMSAGNRHSCIIDI